MASNTMVKIESKSAEEVCRRYPVADEARALLRPGMGPRDFLDALVAGGRIADACKFLAYALPKREAVWWGSLAVKQALGPEPPSAAAEALQTAQAWVINPSDENRRAAMPAAKAAGLGSPVGCLAVAAYFSGGSLAPPDLPPVAPAELLSAKSVANALALSAVLTQPEKAAEKYADFLNEGIAIAEGKNLWPSDRATSPQSR